MWMCKIDVAISCLMLASIIMRADWGEEELLRTISSSSWAWVLYFSFSFLLTKLKQKQLENSFIIQRPGENSGLRGENDGKILKALLKESIRWPLVRFLWRLVSDPMWWRLGMMNEDGESSIRLLSK